MANYQDLLVHVEISPEGEHLVQSAFSLAVRHKARVTGAFLKSRHIANFIDHPSGFVSSIEVEALIEQHRLEMAKLAAAAQEVFERTARERGVEHDWLETRGDSDEEIIRAVRCTDLTLFPISAARTLGFSRLSPAQVGVASGSPLLIFPDRGYSPDFGANVMVAWKNTREAARAVRDAMPILSQAKRVCVVTIGEDAEGEDSRVVHYLKRHGCKVESVVDTTDEIVTADRLRMQSGMTGSDLMVLGLYGHSRVRELILGGVSRDLLANPPMPLLVSH